MNSTTYCIRVDKDLKKEFDAICKEFGLTPSAVFNVYAKKVVREKRIPFVIESQTSNEKVLEPTNDITKKQNKDKIPTIKSIESIDSSLDNISEYIEEAGQFIVKDGADQEGDPEQFL